MNKKEDKANKKDFKNINKKKVNPIQNSPDINLERKKARNKINKGKIKKEKIEENNENEEKQKNEKKIKKREKKVRKTNNLINIFDEDSLSSKKDDNENTQKEINRPKEKQFLNNINVFNDNKSTSLNNILNIGSNFESEIDLENNDKQNSFYNPFLEFNKKYKIRTEKEKKVTNFFNRIIENISSDDENEIINGQTKNTTSFLFSFLDDEDYTRFNTIRNYIQKSSGVYRFGHAQKIKCEQLNKYIVLYYIQFDFATRLSRRKLTYPNIDHINMSGKIVSDKLSDFGEKLIKEGEVKSKGYESIEDVENMSKEERAKLKIQLYNIVEKINNSEETLMSAENSKKNLKVYYLWGPASSGKSDLVYSLFQGTGKYYNVVYYRNGFWYGVSNKTIYAIFDDFWDTLIPLNEFLIFINNRIKYLPIKCGQLLNRYERIFIISELDPEDIYPKDLSKRWIDRMEIFHIDDLRSQRDYKSLFEI